MMLPTWSRPAVAAGAALALATASPLVAQPPRPGPAILRGTVVPDTPDPVHIQPPAPLPAGKAAQPPAPPEPAPVTGPKAAKGSLYAAAESNTYPIDLPTALRLADANNPTAGVARARVREAVAQLDRVRLAWIPNLTFGPSFFYHEGIDQNRRGDIFSVARGNFSLLAGPTLRVDLADALYLPLVARRGVQSAAARSRAVANDIQLEVALAYLDLLELHGLLAINADILARAEQVLRAAEAGAKAGLNKTTADINRAATEVYLRQQERIVLRGRAGAAAARLTRLLLLDPAVELTPFEVAVIPVILVPGELTVEHLIATGLRTRPEVIAAGAELQAAETLVRQAKAAPLLPRAQADFIGGGFSGGRFDQFSPMRGQYNAFVGLAWELDNLGAGNAAAVRARQAAYDAVMFRVQEVRARVAAEVAEAARTSAARFETLAAAQEAVRQALEMYRKFRESSFGMVGPRAQFDALEPLTAVQALNQARVQYLQQVIEFNRSQFRLFTAIGQPAVCGLPGAAPQPVDVPAVPLPGKP
jgi:outer membrane protein TolC